MFAMADKALVLGVDAYRQFPRLSGCGNDARDLQGLLIETFGFPAENVRVLTDAAVVRRNVAPVLEWLLADLSVGDRLALHFSGHGSYTIDRDGDEDPADGFDELLCLHDLDFDCPETYLLDDELARWSRRVPAGVELLVTLDACHSGTGTRELRHTRETSAGSAQRPLAPRLDRLRGRVRFVEPPEAIRVRAGRGRTRRPELAQVTTATMNHVLLAACDAGQTAAEAVIDGSTRGAFTHALTRILRECGPDLDRADLIRRLERALAGSGFPQSPQLESPSDTGPLFAIRTTDPGRRAP